MLTRQDTRRSTLLSFFFTLLVLAGSSTPSAAEWPPWFDLARDVARAEAAALLGVAPEQAEVHGETLRSGFGEEQVALFKISAAEAVLEIAVDEFGAPVDLEPLRAEDLARALDPELKIADELKQAALSDPSGVFPILVWLSEPPYAPLEMPEEAPAEEDLAALEELDAEMRAHLEAHNAPVVAAAIDELAVHGLEAAGSTYAPLVWTEASGQQVLEMAAWSSVARIEEDRDMELALDVARQATFGHVVHGRSHNGHALEGRHRKLAIVEPGSPWTPHPALISASNPITIIRQKSTCTTNEDHATQVMGVIRSTDATDRGLAPAAWAEAGASCSLRASDLIATSDKVVAAGHFVLNFSWGDGYMAGRLGMMDRYADLLTHRLRRNVVAAAGNSGDSWWTSRQFVYSPASSYNSVGVGSLDDRGTASRMDDAMAGSSTWRNPLSQRGDRVKPNLVAPGVNIRTTDINASNWKVSSGTSLAAPMVTAGMGLVLQRAFGLYYSPEAVRAVLMASATNNVEGGAWSTKDGAGGLDLASADDVAAKQGANWGRYRWSCGPFEEKVLDQFVLQGQRLFRAAIAWSADPSFPQNATYDLEPGSDIDLYLTDVSGATIARSTSWDNTHEIIEFVSPFTVTLQLRMKRVRCTMDPGTVGWAWFQDV